MRNSVEASFAQPTLRRAARKLAAGGETVPPQVYDKKAAAIRGHFCVRDNPGLEALLEKARSTARVSSEDVDAIIRATGKLSPAEQQAILQTVGIVAERSGVDIGDLARVDKFVTDGASARHAHVEKTAQRKVGFDIVSGAGLGLGTSALIFGFCIAAMTGPTLPLVAGTLGAAFGICGGTIGLGELGGHLSKRSGERYGVHD